MTDGMTISTDNAPSPVGTYPHVRRIGSDYPFPLGEHYPGKIIEEMDLDRKIRADLLAGAALQWLALDREDFE